MKRWNTSGVFLGLLILVLPVNCTNTENKSQNYTNTDDFENPVKEPKGVPEKSRYGGELIITSGAGSPKHLNPALMSGHAVCLVGTQIFASPLRYDENWNPQPYLAESWEVSEDGLSVTLRLVENAAFHDGHLITSEDVAFSLYTVKAHHPFKPMFDPVERVEIPDPYTVIMKLTKTHPAILLAMSPPLLPVLPKHVFGDGRDIRNHPANLKPVGSGPFLLKEFIPGEYISLERNKRYFVKHRPYLDRIIIHLDNDENEQMIKMEREEAHLMPLFTDPMNINKMSRVNHLAVTTRGYEAFGPLNWLAFNLLRKPLDNKYVRQAIAYAIDPEFITQYLHDSRSRRAVSPIAPNSPFFEPEVHTYDLDLDKANILLDIAGYPVQKDKFRFSLTLDYIPLIPSQQKDIVLYLQRQFKKIGIDISVRKSENFVHWAERISNWDFDMTMDSVYNWGDPVIGVHRTYMSDNIRKGVLWSNTQNYRNQKVDEILTKAGMELDPDKRKILYSEFQRILTEDLPVIWLNVTPFHTVYNTKLKILPTSIWGLLSPFDEIYWKEKPVKAFTTSSMKKKNQDNSLLKKVGNKAITLIRENGLYYSLKVLNNPDEGFLDINKSGLHIIGFTQEGIVFLDNSNQIKSGMDISSILDHNRNKLLPQFLYAAENGNILTIDGIWPHPATDEVGRLDVWCGRLGENDVICSLYWPEGEEEVE